MYQVHVHVYMYRVLGTDLKPQAHSRTIRTVSKSSGQFQSRPDSFKVVRTVSKLSDALHVHIFMLLFSF